jgi:hypothetical protein
MLTWIFCLPNSLAKLCDKALMPNLLAANADVVVLPLIAAVAPVKMSVPFLRPSPASPPSLGVSNSSFVISRSAARAKAKAATTLVSSDSRTSSSVISRNGFQTPYPALKSATRRGEVGQRDLMDANESLMDPGV